MSILTIIKLVDNIGIKGNKNAKNIFGTRQMEKRRGKKRILYWVFGGLFCLVMLALFFSVKDAFTLDGLINATPQNQILAVFFILCLFAIKSVLFFIYGGLLYALCGVLFPLPGAILINIVGSWLMITLPYYFGRKKGEKAWRRLLKKFPKLQILQQLPNKNEISSCFVLRLIGKLPGDLVSVYLGASGIGYVAYVVGSMLGFMPSLIAFSIMGRNIKNPTSPAFIVAFCVELLLIVFAVIWQVYKIKKDKGKKS